MTKKKNKDYEDMKNMKNILEDINELLDDPSFPDSVKEVLQKIYVGIKEQGTKFENLGKQTVSEVKEALADHMQNVGSKYTSLADKLTSMEKNAPKAPEIVLDNSAVEKHLGESKSLLGGILKAMGKFRAEGVSAKLNRNRTSKEYVAVRLSDGDKFYKALFSGGGGAGGGPSFKLDDDTYSDYKGDNGGNLKVSQEALLEQTFYSAKISGNTSGDNEIVAAVAGKKIRVWSYALQSNGTVSAKFRKNTTDLTGAFTFQEREGIAMNGGIVPLFETGENEALNLNLSGAVYAYGHLTYTLV